MTTPCNWRPGDDVVVHASVPTEEARKLFPDLVEHKVSVSIYRYQTANVHAYGSVSPTLGPRRSLRDRHVGRIKTMKFFVVVLSTFSYALVFRWKENFALFEIAPEIQ